MRNPLRTGVVSIALLAGCTYETGHEPVEDVAAVQSALGTVLGQRTDVHLNTAAAETVVTPLHPSTLELTMTFNAKDSPSFISFNGGSRQVFRNASMMAFTTAHINGDTITTGRVRPPSGWAVLWGDPAITRNKADPSKVYLTQLAVPNAKFDLSPTPGVIDGPMNPDPMSVPPPPAELCGAYVGGACIARSSDGGRTFSLAASDCIRRQTLAECPHGTFYDGADIDTSPEGRVYATYFDTERGKPDVYMATSSTGGFARVTNLQLGIATHPRIKYGPGGLYLLAQVGGTLQIARYPAGSSRSATWTTPVTVTNLADFTDVQLSDRFIRVGPQYDLDVGKSEAGVDEIRVVFKTFESGKHHIRVNKCTTGTTISCSHPGAWKTASLSPNADQFMPAIAYGLSSSGAHTWIITYHDRNVAPSGNQLELVRSRVWQNGSNSFMDRAVIESAQVPCPDQRGFWGDYDNMASGPFGVFFRGFTDSFHLSCSRGNFAASPQFASLHVSNIP